MKVQVGGSDKWIPSNRADTLGARFEKTVLDLAGLAGTQQLGILATAQPAADAENNSFDFQTCNDGHAQQRASQLEHGPDPWQGYGARDPCALPLAPAWLPIPAT